MGYEAGIVYINNGQMPNRSIANLICYGSVEANHTLGNSHQLDNNTHEITPKHYLCFQQLRAVDKKRNTTKKIISCDKEGNSLDSNIDWRLVSTT